MAHSPVVLPDGTWIYVQKYEVTVAEWNACQATGACTLALRSVGDRSQKVMPATGLSFDDVAQYVNWINGDGPHLPIGNIAGMGVHGGRGFA